MPFNGLAEKKVDENERQNQLIICAEAFEARR